MKTILLYLLQVIICSGILYSYYHFFLRNKKFHQYNRYFLLLATIISICIPFFNIPVYFDSEEAKPVLLQSLTVFSTAGFEEDVILKNDSARTTWFTLKNILSSFYLLIAGLLFIRFIIALIRIARLVQVYPGEKLDSIHFITTSDPATPFSFFRWLFWNNKIELNSDNGQQILRHELFHIRQKHSWDIIFLEIITMIFWLNPFFHLIKKEIKAIHEFLADQFAVNENQEWYYAELLLMQVLGSPNTRLTNPFFHNQIKRRIAMLTTSKKPGYQYLRKIMVLPLAAIIVGLFAFTYKNKVNNKAIWSEKPITIVVDAGHGGDDPGASSPDTKYKEAQLSLEIAKTIQNLSKEYNITVVMTREDEKFPGGVTDKNEANIKRAAIANELKPVAFISIHMNNKSTESFQNSHSGFEAYVSKKRNAKADKMLASAILQNLARLYKTRTEARIHNQTGVYVLDQNNCPAVLLECGFINNMADLDFIKSKTNQEKIARSILEAIVNFKNATESRPALSIVGPDTIPGKVDNKIFEKVEIEPSFPGGEKSWNKFLQTNINESIPVQKGAPGGKYTVFIQFIVDKDGKVSDITPLTHHGYGMEEQALGVIKKSPRWLPGIQNGIKVKAYKKQRINFIVPDNKKNTTSITADTIKPNNEVVVVGYATNKPIQKKEVAVVGYVTNEPIQKNEVMVVGYATNKLIQKKEVAVVGYTTNEPIQKNEVTVVGYATKEPVQKNEVTVVGYAKDPIQKMVFDKVEIEPAFPGGDAAWRKYLERNLDPGILIENGAPEGVMFKTMIQYIVNADGTISDVRPLTNHGYGIEAELMWLIKNSPEWKPAIQNGKKVNAYRKQPITFVVKKGKALIIEK